MLTWHIVCIIEIPIVVILAHIELSKLNIFNCFLHFAATTLSQADFFWVCCICLLYCKTKAWRVGNEWWLRVPLNVLDVANHNSRNSALLITSTELTKKSEVTPSTLAPAKSNNCFGVRIWFEKWCWRLACAASLLMVPPTLSQASFPFNVAKKFLPVEVVLMKYQIC